MLKVGRVLFGSKLDAKCSDHMFGVGVFRCILIQIQRETP